VRARLRLAGAATLLAAAAPLAGAWPVSLQQALVRDARRLVPRSLAQLIAAQEDRILEETRRFPVELGHALAIDLLSGRLQPETLAALDEHVSRSVDLLRRQQVSDGIVALGATLRIPADLADPVLTAGAEGLQPGVTREYYAFIEGYLDKIPVTLDDPPALKTDRKQLTTYWQTLLDKSRAQSPLLRTEMFPRGRLLDHRAIDYHSPVFAVAQISYSRAVTGIAATWLALWRQARGDLTRQTPPKLVEPKDAPPLPPSSTEPSPEDKP
jgi:hypothetical protein